MIKDLVRFHWVFLVLVFSFGTIFFVIYKCSTPNKTKLQKILSITSFVLFTILLAAGGAYWNDRSNLSFIILGVPIYFLAFLAISQIGTNDNPVYNMFNFLNSFVVLLCIFYFSYVIADVSFETNMSRLVELLIFIALDLVFIIILAIANKKYYLKVAKYIQKVHVCSLLCIVPITFICLIYVNAIIPIPFNKRENYNINGMSTVLVAASITYISLFFLCVHMGNYYELYKLHRNEENKLSLWGAQIESQDEIIKSIRKYDHDRRHHTAIALEFLEAGDIEKAKEYLKEHLNSENFSSSLVTYCNNYTVNCLLTYFVNMAKKEHINCDIQVYIPERLDISDIELVGLYANIVENAIEANKQIEIEKRNIKLRTKYQEGTLRILLENSCDPSIVASSQNHDVIKSKKKIGGYGLQNVVDIVTKFGGIYDYDCKDGKYQTRIIMYIEQFAEDKRSIKDEN